MAKVFLPMVAGFVAVTAVLGFGQAERHGRKYVAQAPAAHVEVTVTKAINGKPVPNAAVIFHPIHQGKDGGNMEIKTNHDGVAVLDLLAIGDTLRLQVVADGFQTFGEEYAIDGDTKLLSVKLQKPATQSSIYAAPAAAPAKAAQVPAPVPAQ